MKKVTIETPIETVSIMEVNNSRIYISDENSLYKLNREIGAGDWCWHCLDDSRNFSDYHKSFEDAIKSKAKSYPVYEFDNLREFAEWLLTKIKH